MSLLSCLSDSFPSPLHSGVDILDTSPSTLGCKEEVVDVDHLLPLSHVVLWGSGCRVIRVLAKLCFSLLLGSNLIAVFYLKYFLFRLPSRDFRRQSEGWSLDLDSTLAGSRRFHVNMMVGAR